MAMINKADPKRCMTQYLLGELPAAERDEFEELYLSSNDVFQELAAVENEMIDKYLLSEMSPTEREKFESLYMRDPARRDAVETARSLLAVSGAESTSVSGTPARKGRPRRQRWLVVGTAAAIVGLVAGASWLLVINYKLKHDMAKLQSEHSALFQEKRMLEDQASRLRADLRDSDEALRHFEQLVSSDTIAFFLGAGVSRGSGEDRLVIPSRASQVLFRIVVEGKSYPHYGLSLSTAEGILTWRAGNIPGKPTHDGTEIVAKVPSSLFRQNGDYVVKVAAGGDDLQNTLAGYSFHVVKR